MKKYDHLLITLYGGLLIFFSFHQPVFSQTTIVKSKYCSPDSSENLPKLIDELMLDLPNYANRVTQRSRRLKRKVDVFSYVLVAGKPDLSPLPLNPGINNNQEYDSADVKQVFFTTLERQYINKKTVELQEFHRLFLTKTNTGWEMVMMFTQTGTYPVKPPIAPARDSSNSAIAQGVKLWLRDCNSRKY